MEKSSGYYLDLKTDSKKRYHYQSKVISTGLRIDPYSIAEWNKYPDVIPFVTWSNVVVYMVTTPSAYTLEEVKVRQINKYKVNSIVLTKYSRCVYKLTT